MKILQPLGRWEERAPSDYPIDVHDVSVLVISYFPLKGGRIDHQVTGDVYAPLEAIRSHTLETTQRVVQALETGSIYHGYKDPDAQPSMRYRIVECDTGSSRNSSSWRRCPRITSQAIKSR
jgi:hypothetical protein